MAVASLFWVEADSAGRLAVAPRPRAGDWLEDEILSWKAAGVDTVASLLCDDEIAELDLIDEAAHCARQGLEFLRFPIADRGLPQSPEAARHFIDELVKRLSDGRAVLIHCRAGIGRTGMIAACCLSALGVEDAFERVGKARGVQVPDTEEQRRWAEAFAHSSNTKSIR